MFIPIEEINNYLNTPEMYDTIQNRLNEDGKVLHTVQFTNIELLAYRDRDLDIKWTILQDQVVIHDNIGIKNLEATVKSLAQA